MMVMEWNVEAHYSAGTWKMRRRYAEAGDPETETAELERVGCKLPPRLAVWAPIWLGAGRRVHTAYTASISWVILNDVRWRSYHIHLSIHFEEKFI